MKKKNQERTRNMEDYQQRYQGKDEEEESESKHKEENGRNKEDDTTQLASNCPLIRSNRNHILGGGGCSLPFAASSFLQRRARERVEEGEERKEEGG